MTTLTYDQVRALKPCPEGLAAASKLIGWPSDRAVSVRDAIEAGVELDDVLYVLGALRDPDVKRRLRLFACDCAARVLPIYERKHDNPAPRNAIIVARRYARGEATRDELDAAAAAAAEAGADAASDAAWCAARGAAGGAGQDAAWVAGAAARAASDAARDARDAEIAWQRARLIERFEGEPEDWPLGDAK